MARFIRLSQEQRDNLVAYLDGELDEAATQQIEQVLAVSEVARHEVDMLSRTWDMLDVLPTHKASQDFTRKTITSLRAAEAKGPGLFGQKFQRNARRGAVLVFWAGILTACGSLGFMATNRWVPNEAEQLIDDYDVINNLDKYSEVVGRAEHPAEFLEVLKSQHTFGDHDGQTGR